MREILPAIDWREMQALVWHSVNVNVGCGIDLTHSWRLRHTLTHSHTKQSRDFVCGVNPSASQK